MSPNQYCSLLQIMHQITSLASHVRLWWTHIGQNLCICRAYLSAILVSNACDVATNPGPPKFPCNICKESCPLDDSWSVLRYMRPMACMGMNTCIYENLASNNVSWQCCGCGMPNFSSSFFDSTISEHTNPFSILSPSLSIITDSRIGEPIAISSPVANSRTSNPKRLQTHKLTVIVTNCRSLVNKKAELINLLDSTKADIAICTETLKAGDETIAKQLAKLYTKCLTERRIPKTWKEANMVIFFKKWNRKDIKNYRPICLLSNMYKLFTKIITTRLEEELYKHQHV